MALVEIQKDDDKVVAKMTVTPVAMKLYRRTFGLAHTN